MLRSIITVSRPTFLKILMISAGHLHQPSANLVIAPIAPCPLKWINLSHVDQNFPVNTFIVVKLQIKIFIPQNALELAAVFS